MPIRESEGRFAVKNIGIMFDHETLGVDPNSVVLEISMVAFDLDSGKLLEDEFETELKYHLPAGAQEKIGRKIDSDTVAWWLKQAKTAQNRLRIYAGSVDELRGQLVGINEYIHYRRQRASSNGGRFEFWSRGCMDINQLTSLFNSYNIEPAWNYFEWRDLRTLTAIAKLDLRSVTPPNGHVQHDSLSDCHFQIRCYREVLQILEDL